MAEDFPDDVRDTVGPPEWSLIYIAGDDPRIGQVEDLCYRTLHEPFGVSRQPDWDNMDPDSIHVAAVDGECVIGYARLIREGHWAHVRQVVVEPRYRRHGIATALVKDLIRLAGSMGLDGVYLNSRMPAVHMYEEVGFAVVSDAPFPMPRTGVPHVRMEMLLR